MPFAANDDDARLVACKRLVWIGAHEQSAADRARYGAAELGARASGRGLWRDGPATPPWESRREAGPELENAFPRY